MSPAGVFLLSLLLVLSASPSCRGLNITDILAAHPEFAQFSAALSSTGAAAEINRRQTITVLAVDNTVMAAAKSLRPEDLKRVISLHVLLDYFGKSKLSGIQGGFAQAATLYQASGNAPGSAGIVNITTRQGGRVAFTASGTAGAPAATVFYLKSVQETPYNISVLQVNALMISSPAAGVQTPAPAPASAPGAASRSNSSTAPLPAPVSAPAQQAPATPVPAPPATAPATPAPAPVLVAPAAAPTPRRRPAPEPPVSSPAPSSDADDNTPPADQKKKNNGATGTASSWTRGTTVAAALSVAIALVL